MMLSGRGYRLNIAASPDLAQIRTTSGLGDMSERVAQVGQKRVFAGEQVLLHEHFDAARSCVCVACRREYSMREALLANNC